MRSKNPNTYFNLNLFRLFLSSILVISLSGCKNKIDPRYDLKELNKKGTRVSYNKELIGFIDKNHNGSNTELRIFDSIGLTSLQLSNIGKNDEINIYSLARHYYSNNAIHLIQSKRISSDNWISYLLKISKGKNLKILDTIIINKKLDHEYATCGNLSKSGGRFIVGIKQEKNSEITSRILNNNMSAPVNRIQVQEINGAILFKKTFSGSIQISENSWNTAEDIVVFNTFYRDTNSIYIINIKKKKATYIGEGQFPQWYSDNQILFVGKDKIYLYNLDTQKQELLFQCKNRLSSNEDITQLIFFQDTETIYFKEDVSNKLLPNIIFEKNYYTLKYTTK